RTVRVLFAAVVAFVLAVAFFVTTEMLDRAPVAAPPALTPVPTTAAPAPGLLGPAPGTVVAAYVTSRAAQVAQATGNPRAVVSFTRFLPEADARRVGRSLTIERLLVAAPGGRPQAVADFGAWAAAQRSEALSERSELERLLPTVSDQDFLRQYRADIDELNRLAAQFEARSPLVFGLVVSGPAGALKAAARSIDVRVVDLAPAVEVTPGDLDGARGLRPEEVTTAGTPATRPPA
ncbi:MAG: hypothetical protein ACRD0F_10280, partial [Acidimicrobiales bacterium]